MAALIRDVWIWRGAATSPEPRPESILIEGNTIIAVGADLPRERPGTEIIDGSGMIAVPGLINAHFHSPVNHMKGRLPSLPLEIFMLYESPALEVLKPTAREAYVRTMLACLEMLRGGVTAVQDDAFFVPHPEPEIIDAVMQAYADCGIRVRVALDQSDLPEIAKLPYLAELLPVAEKAELSRPPGFAARDLLAAYDYLIGRWHGHEGGRLKAAVSCSAPQRVTVDYFRALDELSRRHNLPFYIHILETKVQRVLGLERFAGRSLVRYVADLGLLSDRMNIIHAIWVDDVDLDLIAASGATIAHNPISNLRLGSGVMRFRAAHDRGIPIALGTDEAIADDAVSMWGVAKAAGLLHNLGDPDYERWPDAPEVLDCLFSGGAHAMRLDGEIGAIASGRKADIALLDLDTLAFTPLNDIHRQLVYCENGSSVRLTMVDGRILFRDGRVTTVDEPAIRSEARAIAAAQKPALAEAARSAAVLLPHYRAMVMRAAAQDVGMNRWIGDAAANNKL